PIAMGGVAEFVQLISGSLVPFMLIVYHVFYIGSSFFSVCKNNSPRVGELFLESQEIIPGPHLATLAKCGESTIPSFDIHDTPGQKSFG
ncbi:MAG: hypothetical protein LUE91_00905, partial [Oscillospiraceae bacterium]|nr:hypothetical protein [Oscillospiraceae bacterium]